MYPEADSLRVQTGSESFHKQKGQSLSLQNGKFWWLGLTDVKSMLEFLIGEIEMDFDRVKESLFSRQCTWLETQFWNYYLR